jgi:gamma-glutamyltranspeptidase
MSTFTTRPVAMGTRDVVTSGHYLATAAGFRIMEQGSNANDSAHAELLFYEDMAKWRATIVEPVDLANPVKGQSIKQQ